MTIHDFIDSVLLEVCSRLPCGGLYLDFQNNPNHLTLLEEVLLEHGISATEVKSALDSMLENEHGKSTLDIALLKQLGMQLRNEDDFARLDINDPNIEQTQYESPKRGNTVFDTEYVSYRRLLQWAAQQKEIKIFVAKSLMRISGDAGLNVVTWRPNYVFGGTNQLPILGVYKLNQMYPEKISITATLPTGIRQELDRADEINEFLATSERPWRLYINKDGTIVPTSFDVSRSIKIEKTQGSKADLALLNQRDEEVFWISVKTSDYLGEKGQVLSSIDFTRYGRLKTLYDTYANKNRTAFSGDVKGEDVKRLFNTFLERALQINGHKQAGLLHVIDVDVKGKDIIFTHRSGKKSVVNESHPAYISTQRALKKAAKAVRKYPGINLYFITLGTPTIFLDLMKENGLIERDVLNTIAGKAIYGDDFYLGNTTFSRNNLNMILQTKQHLVIKHHMSAGEVTGVILGTDERGHIMFNPNLPTKVTDSLQQIIDYYVPVMSLRQEPNEDFEWTDDAGDNMLFNAMLEIVPKAKIPGKKQEIEI